MEKIALIGAGFTSALLYHFLHQKYNITIFEKSRGAGGRLSTRLHDGLSFNHGTGFFKAKCEKFIDFLSDPLFENKISVLDADFYAYDSLGLKNKISHIEKYFTSQPNINILCKDLINPKDLVTECEITQIHKINQWSLTDKNQNIYDGFDWVISTAPLPQTQNLFKDFTSIEDGFYDPCYCFMGATNLKSLKNIEICYFNDGIVKNIFAAPSILGDYFIMQMTPQWTMQYLNIDREEIKKHLFSIIQNYYKFDEILYQSVHRWLYAQRNDLEFFKILPNQKMAFLADGIDGVEGCWRNVLNFIKEF